MASILKRVPEIKKTHAISLRGVWCPKKIGVDEMSKKPITKDSLIKKEFNRLKRIYKDIPDDRKKSAQELMHNAAFISVTLKELQTLINENGTSVEYQNGENQWGTKQNPDVSTYNSFMQRYNQVMTLLLQQLPRAEGVEEDIYVGLRKPK